jgi:hypothetical protein
MRYFAGETIPEPASYFLGVIAGMSVAWIRLPGQQRFR